MTFYRLKNDPVTGNVALFTVLSRVSADNAPINAPLASPERLQFSTECVYPSTTPALTQSVVAAIPARAANTKFSGQINLFAHGLGEPCMVEGGFFDPDAPSNFVAFNGSMPVKVTATGHAVWLVLGATNTHVVLVYFGITYAALPAFSVTVEASAYDFLATGPAPTGNPALPTMRHVPNQYLQMGRGRFDTRRRYIRKAAAGAGGFAMATGPTLSIVGAGITQFPSYVQNELGWRWRYSCAGYVKQTTQGWNGAATNGGTHDAPHILVRR